MKKAYFLKKTGLLLALTMLITALSACGVVSPNIQAGPSAGEHGDDGKTGFNIEYELGDEFTDIFTDTPQKADAGDTVDLKTAILYDADLHVYVDGQEISKTHYDSDFWGYSFTMPEKDVLVSARFYTKDEVWGIPGVEESALREKYPEYFDLPTTKGLEVYVWQIVPNSYSCGVMSGTNREKTLEEMLNLKGASIDEMKAILSSYNIPKEDIIVIPWQNPISSYIGEFWISREDEDPDSLARRRQEYLDKLREMLIDSEETGFYGSELRIQVNGKTMTYERYEAGIGSLTPKTVLDTFTEATEIEGIVWDAYSAEEYPDLTFILVISGTNASWTYRLADSIAADKTDYDGKIVTETVELPKDFAFSIVWGCYGISSYDSKTGKLVKTEDATDVSKYTCRVQLTEDQMAEVYRILFSEIDIFQYPDAYDPFNAPDAEVRVASEPNQTIIISVTANGRTKTVTCSEVAFGSSGYCEEARAFMSAENEIVELITSLPEWAAFPEYEFFYA